MRKTTQLSILKKNDESRRGFTLIEIIIVLGIMAGLMGIAVVSYRGVTKTGQDTVRKADLESIRLKLQDYYTDNDIYPNSLLSLTPPLPKDPVTKLDYFYKCVDIACNDYYLATKLGSNSDPTTTPVCQDLTEYNNYCLTKNGLR